MCYAGGAFANVKQFGAVGDGVANDRPAIQRAIDSLAPDGGTVFIPAGVYLLDSWAPAAHPWMAYNILVGSNVHIKAQPGTKFLQGPNGRMPIEAVPGADYVRNSVLVFGSPGYTSALFQDPNANGGFYPLHPTQAGSSTVDLVNAADMQNFVAGDYVAMYQQPIGDVTMGEMSQVKATGMDTITLTAPLARSFSDPVIANVSHLATENCAIKNVTVEGSEPLTTMEVFHLAIEDCAFMCDTSIGGSNIRTLLNCNTTRDYRFTRCQFGSVGGGLSNLEFMQRCSQDGVIEDCVMDVTDAGFGEYAAHMTMRNNRMTLHAASSVMIALAAVDVTFANNQVTGIGDVDGVTDYGQGAQIVITGNTFDFQINNMNGLHIGNDVVIKGNDLRVSGVANAILMEGQPTATIVGNHIHGGPGIVVDTYPHDASIVSFNKLEGGNYGMGIYVTTPSQPNTGGHAIVGNVITNFETTVSCDPAMHPGTVVIEPGGKHRKKHAHEAD